MACAQPSPAAGDRGVRSDDATIPVAQFAGQANDIAQESEILPRSSVRRRQRRRHQPELHRVYPDRATPRKLRCTSNTATAITHSQNIR